jgi:hypothetical protein
MKESTRKLLDQIDNEHDWLLGQTRSRGGTQLSRTDTCRACLLSRQWLDDRQNGINDDYTFFDEGNQMISARRARERGCN